MSQLSEPDHHTTTDEPTWTGLVPRVLDAYIAAPDDLHRRVDHALLWRDVASRQPVIAPGAGIPVGYSVCPDGSLQDAMLVERALHVLTDLIDDGVTGPALLQARAELRMGWGQLEAAAIDLRAALATCPPGADGDWWREAISGQLAMAETASFPRLRRKERKELEQLAERVGRHSAGLVVAEPPRLDFFTPSAVQATELAPTTQAMVAEAASLGLVHFGWAQNRRECEKLPRRALFGLWIDAEGAAVTTVMSVRESPIAAMTTLLTDGTMLETIDYPSRYLPQGGPTIDRLIVDVDGSLTDLARLHAQRLRIVEIDRPGTTYRPVTDERDIAEMWHLEWETKRAYRLSVGKSETEARAIPVQRPEFIPLVRAAAMRAVSAAHAAERRAA